VAALETSSAGRSRAVVIGASLAGMSAARALCDHFARVTVVERDRLDGAEEFRPGVPQARQVHALLRGGSDSFERLCPGLEAQLVARGACSGAASAKPRVGRWCSRAAFSAGSASC
jgi:flavin-dependent dehydrogenase